MRVQSDLPPAAVLNGLSLFSHRHFFRLAQEQLAVRAAGQLHVVISGGAYTSLPLSIPNNTRITVNISSSYIAAFI